MCRFAVEPGSRGEGNLLLGVLGTTAAGYGGGVAVGMQVADSHPGFVAVSPFQSPWGKRHHNPWAEHKAAEPQTTPAFIWKLLGAIDPIVGSDGCVWTEPTPERPSTRWFCIGKADPHNPWLTVLQGRQERGRRHASVGAGQVARGR